MATSRHLQTSAEDKQNPFIIQLSGYGLSKVFKYYLNIRKSSTLELIDENMYGHLYKSFRGKQTLISFGTD